jgi:hypothetical protein
VTAWVTTKLAGAWAWMMGAAAAVALAAGAYAAIRKGGKDAARAEAAVDVAKRTRMATQARVEAMRPITKEEEARDPFNRDRR